MGASDTAGGPGRATAELPLTVARGFCMGSADIVPGVSGGTISHF